MLCQRCGLDAATRYVTFYQNIGLLFVRFPSSVQGHLCKRCIHRCFWRMTLTSLVAGWWGIISFFTNIFFIFSNVGQYLACLGMPAPAAAPRVAQAWQPELAPFAAERIERHKDDILASLQAGERLETVCERISDRANVSPGQVRLYLQRRLQGEPGD